jgi:signal transduction histidine kinase
MDSVRNTHFSVSAFRSLDRLFDTAKKATVIQLRWPLVILCSYLLLYSPNAWLPQGQTHVLLVFYILTNGSLYFIADESFDSPYFYGPLLVFDTAFLAAVLALSGGATPDFYVACLLTLILSCICNDSKGLLVVTLLAPVLYAYVVFNSATTVDPTVYLRVPFPLVISLFYGYFAQVERLKRTVREKEEQLRRQQKAADDIRRQRERLEALHEVNVAVTSTIVREKILEAFLDKALVRLPYTAAIVRLRDPKTGVLETAAVKGLRAKAFEISRSPAPFFDRVAEIKAPVTVRDVFGDSSIEDVKFFRHEGLLSFVSLPLIANAETLGSLTFLTREEHEFSGEEIGFLSTLAGQVAIAFHHSQLFDQIQEQASQLRKANKIKDEFLGVVSHELKTPLNVISGYTNMLIEGMLGEISPIQEKALQTVSRQSKELHNLITSVLQVSSIEAEMLQAEFQEVNFWEFLSELRASYDYALPKDVKVKWDFPPDLPTAKTDRAKLGHILTNLINNAIKFTDQGSVTISAHHLSGKKLMEFKVADSGIGISADQISTIFERFRQVDSSDTRAYGGVGLGLYIVKKYTTLLGGVIDVESKLGKGSTFTLRVPCDSKKAPFVHQQLSFPCEAEASSGGLI